MSPLDDSEGLYVYPLSDHVANVVAQGALRRASRKLYAASDRLRELGDYQRARQYADAAESLGDQADALRLDREGWAV